MRPPLIKPSGAGTTIEAMGLPHLFKLTAAETGGLLSFEEFTLAPGAMGARPHVHEQHDEHFPPSSAAS